MPKHLAIVSAIFITHTVNLNNLKPISKVFTNDGCVYDSTI